MEYEKLVSEIQREIKEYEKSGGQEDKACACGLGIANRMIMEANKAQKVELPAFVADLVNWTTRNNAVPSDVITEFKINNDVRSIEVINLPRNELELGKLSKYFEVAWHRYSFEKACFCGYVVK